ncbi:MAG: DUF924 domain-containing protein [Bdellovibrionales bacterium]|nr:DUF924 domain-containing protein [Bdellovibrionales bacterium]NQZ18636.1 DUF924 domain-containing protein [Bdellovibrionales bacterium]
MKSNDIIQFWFEEIESKQHWVKDPAFDQMIKERFFDIHEQARQSALYQWRETALGRLAEIIILDQFSRNMYRDTPQAFSQDPLALALSQEAVRIGADKELTKSQAFFLYIPYMHSESVTVHEEALKLFSQEGFSNEFEIKHKVIIDRFGRYPHRNKILGRTSTEEEIEFLKEPSSSF